MDTQQAKTTWKDLPVDILLNIIFSSVFDDFSRDGFSINAYIPDLQRIFFFIVTFYGVTWFNDNIDAIISFIITHDHLLSFFWILASPERERRYLDLFLRFTHDRLKRERIPANDRDNKRIFRILETASFYGRQDIIKKIVDKDSCFASFLPSFYKDLLCNHAGKYNKLDIGETYMKEEDGTVNMKRARNIFRGALCEGHCEIYETLYHKLPNIIDWEDSILEYHYAKFGLSPLFLSQKKSQSVDPITFLLKHDPRTHHVTSTFKAVVMTFQDIYPNVGFYRLDKPLSIEDCVSKQLYYP